VLFVTLLFCFHIKKKSIWHGNSCSKICYSSKSSLNLFDTFIESIIKDIGNFEKKSLVSIFLTHKNSINYD